MKRAEQTHDTIIKILRLQKNRVKSSPKFWVKTQLFVIQKRPSQSVQGAFDYIFYLLLLLGKPAPDNSDHSQDNKNPHPGCVIVKEKADGAKH